MLALEQFFPPSTAIFTAIRYLINVCCLCFGSDWVSADITQTTKAVSADYDRITEFFEDLDLYLHRLKILETQIPLVVELKVAIAQVLTSVLVLCGICVKYVKMNRLSNSPFSSPSFLVGLSGNLIHPLFAAILGHIFIFPESPSHLFLSEADVQPLI